MSQEKWVDQPIVLEEKPWLRAAAFFVLDTRATWSYYGAAKSPPRVVRREHRRKRKVCSCGCFAIGHMMVAYRFSADCSGQTPIEVLGETTGVLQVDGYTGYNQVTTPKKRKRAGCWAHARRKFFAAFETNPDEAHVAIDLIRGPCEVEYKAVEKNYLRSERHAALRRTRSKAIVDELMRG